MTTKTFHLELLGFYKFELLNLHLDFVYDRIKLWSLRNLKVRDSTITF